MIMVFRNIKQKRIRQFRCRGIYNIQRKVLYVLLVHTMNGGERMYRIKKQYTEKRIEKAFFSYDAILAEKNARYNDRWGFMQ